MGYRTMGRYYRTILNSVLNTYGTYWDIRALSRLPTSAAQPRFLLAEIVSQLCF